MSTASALAARRARHLDAPKPDLAAVKTRQQAAWSSGDYAVVGSTLQIVGEQLCEALDLRSGHKVLDVAAGNGNVSLAAARRWCEVTSTDYVPALLDRGRARAAADGFDIVFKEADAEALPFADNSFDAVVSTFGVMFASRPEAAAAELARVCRRGGRIALTSWLPDSNLYKMFEVMKRYMPPPPTPAPPSPFEWGRTERIQELLGRNFRLRFEKGVSYYREPNAEAAWGTFATGYGPTRSLAASLGPDRLAALREDFIAFHAGFATDLGICVPREYWVTVGMRI
jgi:SAM-dependent methyltransferase